MIKKGISQDTLKLIACAAMLIDHVGVIFGLGLKWRAIGRLAFPIYCFLLTEGARHTRNPQKYALRLAVGAVLAEFAFDFSFYGHWTWQHQSVMLTLLLGFCAIELMKGCPNILSKVLVVIPFVLIAQWLNTDYHWYGVLLVILFAVAWELPHKWLLLTCGMTVLFLMMPSAVKTIFGIRIPVQLFGLASLVPIALYSGKKKTNSKIAQWAYYLFYPSHMLALRLLWLVLR